jgi:hypothetical protein
MNDNQPSDFGLSELVKNAGQEQELAGKTPEAFSREARLLYVAESELRNIITDIESNLSLLQMAHERGVKPEFLERHTARKQKIDSEITRVKGLIPRFKQFGVDITASLSEAAMNSSNVKTNLEQFNKTLDQVQALADQWASRVERY